jgi:hypothetical protein
MKNTLRLIAAVAVLAVAAPAYAQRGGGGGGGMQMSPEQRMARQKEQLFAGITLTPAAIKIAEAVATTNTAGIINFNNNYFIRIDTCSIFFGVSKRTKQFWNNC